MDSIFLLSSEARNRFLHSTAHNIEYCVYICIWFYHPYPSNCLICTDGWLHEQAAGVARTLFAMYRGSFVSVESGILPGLAYKERWTCVELAHSELTNLASIEFQRQFYQEAGIKKAAFMGAKNGVIELGMSELNTADIQMIQQLFRDEIIQQYNLPSDQIHPPSSSSSSLRSLSTGSPEYSSLMLPPTPHVQFPTPSSEHQAIMRAMLTVMSSASASSSASPSSSASRYGAMRAAFEPYNAALAPRNVVEFKSRIGGHSMIKMGIAMMRRLHFMRAGAGQQLAQEPRPPPSSNQSQHVISERKRREKINESFQALKLVLPPGSKKDKASVLISTRNYISNLKSQLSKLEEKNQMLELQLLPADDDASKEGGESNERVEVQITRAPESTSQTQGINLRIIIRGECDMTELVLRVLECLKQLGGVSLVSVNANTFSDQQIGLSARLNLSLQAAAGDWDEESFREAVTSVVEGVLVVPPETTNQ